MLHNLIQPGDKLVSDYYVDGSSGKVIIGSGTFLLDWVRCFLPVFVHAQVHVDNVAHAHVLAEKALTEKPRVVSGQIYNIGSSFSKDEKPIMTHGQLVGDGEPGTTDHWGFENNVVYILMFVSCPRPGKIPLWLVVILAFVNEFLWNFLGTTLMLFCHEPPFCTASATTILTRPRQREILVTSCW